MTYIYRFQCMSCKCPILTPERCTTDDVELTERGFSLHVISYDVITDQSDSADGKHCAKSLHVLVLPVYLLTLMLHVCVCVCVMWNCSSAPG